MAIGGNVSGSGQGPKSGKVVGNGLRMVARGCQGSPEVLVGLKCGLQTVLGPGGAARGQFWPKLTIRAATSTVGGGFNRSTPVWGPMLGLLLLLRRSGCATWIRALRIRAKSKHHAQSCIVES